MLTRIPRHARGTSWDANASRMKALLLTFVAGACASTPAPPAVAPPTPAKPAAKPYRIPARTEDIVVAVTAYGVTINGVRLGPAATVADIEKLLGPPDRVEDLAANIL